MSDRIRLRRAAPRPASAQPRAGRLGRVIAAGVIALMLTALGCAKPKPYRGPSDYERRFAGIQRITLVPPLVAVYSMSSGNMQEEVQDWSDAANDLSKVTVKKIVEASGKTYVPYAGRRGPRPDFRLGVDGFNERPQVGPGEQSWLLFESAKEAILRHTYDAMQTFPSQKTSFDYTLGKDARSLLAGTRADAFLLMIATDYVPTAERSALIGIGAATALLTGAYAGPGATPAELMAALVDARTGDILFFNKVSMPLADLRSEKGNAQLVGAVLKGMDR